MSTPFNNKIHLLLTVTFLISLSFCKKKDDNKPTDNAEATTFDKKAMLENMADNVIIPDYNHLKSTLDSVDQSFENFKLNYSPDEFKTLKTTLHRAYLTYQRVNIYGLGPGEDLSIRSNFNVFPCNTSLIHSNIHSGNYNLESLSNLASKGFPALDYLVYGLNKTEEDQIQQFKTDPKRVIYFTDVLNNMRTKINSAINTWQTSYRETFINSLGTDIGSSIGFLVNQLNYELDYLKNSKIGIPLGLKSGGILLPDNCEAYYGGQSLEYALETLRAIENLYLGRDASANNGKGFDDYIQHLDLKHSSGSLFEAIQKQFTAAKNAMMAISNPLSEQVKTNSTLVNTAHRELVKLLVLLKTDMPSGLGVIITYQDGDGD